MSVGDLGARCGFGIQNFSILFERAVYILQETFSGVWNDI